MNIIGSGGHAKVVYEALVTSRDVIGDFAIRDGNADREHDRFYEHIIRFPEIVESMKGAFAHIAIGSNDARRMLHHRLVDVGVSLKTISHPNANISDYSKAEAGCFFAAFSIVGPDCHIGKSTIINHAAVVDHDCQIGDFSHIAPNATLGGNVMIGKNCLIGANATILPGISITDNVVIGAGSVVVRDIEHDEKDPGYWIGNPAQNRGKS